MTRAIHKLSAKDVREFTGPGRLHDGGGLYFYVTERGGRSWECRIERNGKRKLMGLGRVSLAKARELHKAAMAKVADGIDPIAARKASRQITAASLTVMQAAEKYLAVKQADWATEGYPDQIRGWLKRYVKPTIGDLPITDIRFDEAKLVLAPIWDVIRPTAKRLCRHLRGTVYWAIGEGIRTDESNPFEPERLEYSLSFAKTKVIPRAALPFDRAPEFMALLREQQESVKTLALQFVLLNAVRVGDVCGGGKAHSLPMLWSHVDLDAAIWTIPDTKMGRPLVVPLSDAALRVLAQVKRFRDPGTDFVFPGAMKGTVISDSTLRYLIADLGYKGLMTTHGCRSMFRTWASEVTSFDKPVVEMALAHAQSKLDQAYMRGALLNKRKLLMESWADFLEGEAMGTVVPLRA